MSEHNATPDNVTTLNEHADRLRALIGGCTDSAELQRLHDQLADVRAQLDKLPAAQRWPAWVPDLEALGVLVVLSADPYINTELIAGRVHDLGYVGPVGESEWRRDLMLRTLWANANEATRKIITDSDAIQVAHHVWQEMTGEIVSL